MSQFEDKFKKRLEKRIVDCGLRVVEYELEYILKLKSEIDKTITNKRVIEIYNQVIDDYKFKDVIKGLNELKNIQNEKN